MVETIEPRALVVGDDDDERRRIISWFRPGWTAEDGGAPAAAVDRATESFRVVVYTAATDSVDLDTWHMALRLSGFGGRVIDTRVRGPLPAGVTRAASPTALAELLAD